MATAPVVPTDPSAASSSMMKLENTEKRDTLIEIEKRYQQKWQEEKCFEVDAPSEDEEKVPKFYGTFAFPYMNGILHAGHAFTVSKIEFGTGFARMDGRRALFPLGYHVTGLPIKACADKLVKEVEKFGQDFSGYNEDEEEVVDTPVPQKQQAKEDVTKFTTKKSKAAAKNIKAKYQFQIMLSQGIPKEELHKFADTAHWLQYFPPLCKRDLINFGARIDWRRQFVTTDANPYFDAFVRWQMNRLHDLGKIKFGPRYTIYSPKDGQPCMDHDRSKGEGVLPQEYTALKLKVKEWAPKAAELVRGKIPDDAEVFFVPATLRPETMYGQTCCFVGPNITYGLFKASDNVYYVFTRRAAWNLAFQGTFFKTDHFPSSIEELSPVVEFQGSIAIGTLVNAPLSVHTQGLRILPMDSIIPTKGTGVVTCVPSDSPDDFVMIRELAKKADYYGIQKEWAEMEIIPILNTPSYGDLTAKFIVEKMKIQSPKDVKQLTEAKEAAYKEGHFNGKMLIGDHKGKPVEQAKPLIRDALINAGEAFGYAEPSAQVVSRSGDECVVAYLGQWFLNYGDQDVEWRDSVLDYVKTELETYGAETRNALEAVLGWLNRWSCARTYGLGSKLPWDRKFMVEGLSDSTIYMAYYTIAHYLHSDLYGKKPGRFNIRPEQMSDDIWDYIFTRTEYKDDLSKMSGISKSDLQTLRHVFEYWYPLDIRGSGKDLLGNHLTFCLYIHAALFPKTLWPRSIRSNGHLLLNGEKMSKSTGNFLTLKDAVDKFGADATRVAMADAGDGSADANFDEGVANSNILRLFTLKGWCEETLKESDLRTGPADTLFDKMFENEMYANVHEAYQNYQNTDYKLALKSALYDFVICRDFYREATRTSGISMHKDLVTKYVELQALVLAPVAPHWSEYMWQEVLGKGSSIQIALWPKVPQRDPSLAAAREYVRATSTAVTSSEAAQLKKKSKGKASRYDPKAPKKLTIYVAKAFPSWQRDCIELLREQLKGIKIGDGADAKVDDKKLMESVRKLGDSKKAMPFVQNLQRRIRSGEEEEAVFNKKLAFNENEVVKEMVKGLQKQTGCKSVEVISVDEGAKSGEVLIGEDGRAGQKVTQLSTSAENAVPGNPTFEFENIEA